MLSSAWRAGGEQLQREKSHFLFSLLLYSEWKCSSLGGLSKEHQIITYQLDYVIVRIGFLFGEAKECESLTQREAQRAAGTRWDLSF